MTTIDPGDGYLLLDVGAIQEAPDEFFSRRSQSWKPVYNVGLPVKRGEYVRRRETTITTSGPYIAIEVHREEVQRLESHITELLGQLEDGYRDAKEQQAEIERLKAELDALTPRWKRGIPTDEEIKNCWIASGGCHDSGPKELRRVFTPEMAFKTFTSAEWYCVFQIPKQPQSSPEPEWFDLTPFGEHRLRKDIDQYEKSRDDVWLPIQVYDGATIDSMKSIWGQGQKFRCLLKDAPPELVAKASKPAEDPDEWVTQDRVEERLCDQRRVCDVMYGAESGWRNGQISGKRHGHEYDCGHMLELRCRRRDLPPMPEPKPKTEREVLLYWYDGNVVGRYADCPPTDQSFIPLIVRDGKVFIETETREVVR